MMPERMKKFDEELFQAELINLLKVELINLLRSHGLLGCDITLHINQNMRLPPEEQILNIKMEFGYE